MPKIRVPALRAHPALRRRLEVLVALAVADGRVRYGRSRLRTFQWLLDPYATLGVYLLLVAFVLDRPGRAAGLSIACAIVPYQLIVATVTNAMTAVEQRRTIITNMAFDRVLIPLASAVTELVGFAAALTLLALMMAVYGVVPTAAVLWLPVLIAVTFALAVAVAYPATLAGLWFPQSRPLLLSLVRASFFVAPGFVALTAVQGAANDLLRINPLTGLFESYRSVFADGVSPASWELAVPFGVSALLIVSFVPVFRREARHLAKLVVSV